MSLFELVEGLDIEVNDTKVVEGERDIAPVEMHLVVTAVRSKPDMPESLRGRSVLILPNKKRLIGGAFDVDLRTNFGSQSVLEINGLPIEGGGLYEFVTEFKESTADSWKAVSSIPLLVTLTKMKGTTVKREKSSGKKRIARRKSKPS